MIETPTDPPRHINDLIDEIISKKSLNNNNLGYFIDFLHERGFGVLIFLFALPMAIPIPVPPGVNILFATPLLFLTFQQIYGAKKPWLPEKIRKRNVNHDKMVPILEKSKPWLNRLSFFIKPRMAFITHGYLSNLIGVFGFLFALCVSIPVPMTNTVPSFAIMLMALGILMRDGLAVIGGMIVGCLWITLLGTLGITGFKALINAIIGG